MRFNDLDPREMASYIAFHFLGTPYVWGGDDPSGFDCSGFCVEILKSVGALPKEGDWNAAMLAKQFPALPIPREGCLVFYSAGQDQRISHVEYCLSPALAIGASGGGSKTVSPADAWRQNAYIKVRPIKRGRHIAGYADPFSELEVPV